MLTFSSGSKTFKIIKKCIRKYKKSKAAMEAKTCPGKCSSKIKTNNYSKSTKERALLLIKSQTKSLQLN